VCLSRFYSKQTSGCHTSKRVRQPNEGGKKHSIWPIENTTYLTAKARHKRIPWGRTHEPGRRVIVLREENKANVVTLCENKGISLGKKTTGKPTALPHAEALESPRSRGRKNGQIRQVARGQGPSPRPSLSAREGKKTARVKPGRQRGKKIHPKQKNRVRQLELARVPGNPFPSVSTVNGNSPGEPKQGVNSGKKGGFSRTVVIRPKRGVGGQGKGC